MFVDFVLFLMVMSLVDAVGMPAFMRGLLNVLVATVVGVLVAAAWVLAVGCPGVAGVGGLAVIITLQFLVH